MLLVPVVIGIFVLKAITRGYNGTRAMRIAIADAKRLATGTAAPLPAPISLDGSIRIPPAP